MSLDLEQEPIIQVGLSTEQSDPNNPYEISAFAEYAKERVEARLGKLTGAEETLALHRTKRTLNNLGIGF